MIRNLLTALMKAAILAPVTHRSAPVVFLIGSQHSQFNSNWAKCPRLFQPISARLCVTTSWIDAGTLR